MRVALARHIRHSWKSASRRLRLLWQRCIAVPLRQLAGRGLRRFRQWKRPSAVPQSLGRRGEQAAANYLRRLGYRVLGMAVRMRGGELDLVAFDGPTLVFVEVKTRRDAARGSPLLAIDAHKRRRMTSGALAFMKRHGLLGQPARFDCVAVVWPELAREPTIEHVRHAFEAEGHGGFYS